MFQDIRMLYMREYMPVACKQFLLGDIILEVKSHYHKVVRIYV
jgi:hypothetical protein